MSNGFRDNRERMRKNQDIFGRFSRKIGHIFTLKTLLKRVIMFNMLTQHINQKITSKSYNFQNRKFHSHFLVNRKNKKKHFWKICNEIDNTVAENRGLLSTNMLVQSMRNSCTFCKN